MLAPEKTMPTPAMRTGDAVDLPSGTYDVVAETRYDAPALSWRLWELEDDSGEKALLAQVRDCLYTPRLDELAAWPGGDEMEVEGVSYKLHSHGEARAQHSGPRGHDFWLARFRHYQAPGKVALVTEDKEAVHRLLGEVFDERLLQVHKL